MPGRKMWSAGRVRPRSVSSLLRELVPEHPLSHLGPHLPLEALRCYISMLSQPAGLLHGIMRRLDGNETPEVSLGQVRDTVQIASDRAPPPPIVGQDAVEASQPDGSRRIAIAHLVRRQEVHDVLNVLLVLLHDLKLGQQEV